MSFKSGNLSSGLQTSEGAAKDLTMANVNDANQRAELDAQVSRQQATENAKRKGELHKEAQEDEIPEGYVRFVSANKHMSYVKKNGEVIRWYNGRLDTDDKDAIAELRAALKGGNNVFWEVRPKNVAAAPKQKEAETSDTKEDKPITFQSAVTPKK